MHGYCHICWWLCNDKLWDNNDKDSVVHETTVYPIWSCKSLITKLMGSKNVSTRNLKVQFVKEKKKQARILRYLEKYQCVLLHDVTYQYFVMHPSCLNWLRKWLVMLGSRKWLVILGSKRDKKVTLFGKSPVCDASFMWHGQFAPRPDGKEEAIPCVSGWDLKNCDRTLNVFALASTVTVS